MTGGHQDIRAQRSKLKLTNALFDLLDSGTTIPTLSVGELVAQAGVTRSTFYAHYRDKGDFYQQLQDELRRDFFQATMTKQYTNTGVAYPVLNLTAGFQYVAAQAKAFQILNKCDTGHQFVGLFENQLRAYLADFAAITAVTDQLTGMPLEIVIDYRVMALVGVAVRWVNLGMIYSAPYMAEILTEISQHDTGSHALDAFFLQR